MRKKFLLFVFLFSIFLVSCNKNNIENSEINNEYVKIQNLMTYEDFVKNYNLENEEILTKSFIECFIKYQEITNDKANNGIDYGLLCKDVYIKNEENLDNIYNINYDSELKTIEIENISIQDIKYIILNDCDYPNGSHCVADYYMLDVENNIIYHSGVTDGAKCSINPVREIDVKETNNIIIVIYNFLLNDYGSWQKVMDGEAKGLKGEDGGDLWWDLSIITKNKKIIRYRDYTFNKDNLNLFTE